ncbi:MAG: hypothetical protein ABWY33_00280, partial [Cellulomonas sp.]
MGFYVKDLYVQRVPKFQWHDKLTNPPTVPETSPIIQIAALSPQIAEVQVRAGGGGGGVFLPADDNTVYTIPSLWTSVISSACGINEADMQIVRVSLVATLKAVDQQIEGLQ